MPLAPFLAENDIVVNCTLQDTAAPLIYLPTEDLAAFRPGSLIVDVSCDEGMGFELGPADDVRRADVRRSATTSHYYARRPQPVVPVELRDLGEQRGAAAVPAAGARRAGRRGTRTRRISRAIEIRDGRVVNPAILDFQHRSAEYPYAVSCGRLLRLEGARRPAPPRSARRPPTRSTPPALHPAAPRRRRRG